MYFYLIIDKSCPAKCFSQKKKMKPVSTCMSEHTNRIGHYILYSRNNMYVVLPLG